MVYVHMAFLAFEQRKWNPGCELGVPSALGPLVSVLEPEVVRRATTLPPDVFHLSVGTGSILHL